MWYPKFLFSSTRILALIQRLEVVSGVIAEGLWLMLLLKIYMMCVIEYWMRYGWLWLELDAAARDAKGQRGRNQITRTGINQVWQ